AGMTAGWDRLWGKLTGGGLPSAQHMAVLRFVGIGADESMNAFNDGLMETLTSKLTQLEQYEGARWVVPASEIRSRDIQSVGDARDAFNVTIAITGSIQRRGTGYRLIINVVNAKTERQLKSAIIDDPMIDASVFQDATVVKLAEMLDLTIQPQTREALTAGGTTKATAYEVYLQGRGYLQQRGMVENIDRSIELFRQAIDQDSLYALAYAGLAEAYWRKYDETQEIEWVDDAKATCVDAIRLNDMLAPVHVTLGIINRGTGHNDDAIGNFQRALELDPANYEARLELAVVYRALGRAEQAEETYLKAIELRPEYWAGYTSLGYFYYRQGRLEDAEKMFR
ncbi:MAG: tetratricopeptide repeat protein, partial [Candidatus Krumholzibacteria bacterium]|nr:tetratricopeptide repeat protein [Candidatus Krumholzibacteria bacterium]